jgi:lipopolysaccharide export system protein LptA
MKLNFSGLCLLLLAPLAPIQARTSDRQQPMDVLANQTTGSFSDDAKTTLMGDVAIDQGSLHITSDQAVLHLANGDISSAIFTGAPTKMHDQLDDGTDFDATANQVDYDMSSHTVVFTGSALLRQPRGTTGGDHLVYNMETGAIAGGGPVHSRVKMHVLPRSQVLGLTKPAPKN